MYSLYRQTDPATIIDQAVYCNFMNDSEKHLIISGGSYLRVFRLNPYVRGAEKNDAISSRDANGDFEDLKNDAIPSASSNLNSGRQPSVTTKLECILQFPLYGNILSMGAGRLPKMSRDAIFLAFEEAKLSVVQYDPDEHDLKILSMHCFEDDVLRCGFTKRDVAPQQGCSADVRVDPDDRCAALLLYGRHLAVVPFTRDVLFGDEFDGSSGDKITSQNVNTSTSSNSAAPFLHSFSVPLEQIESKLQNVSDFTFLYGYYEPTILFLYEPIQTTSGRVAIRQDTYCILAVSLNVKDRTHAVIWTVNNLPFDCFRMFAVPKPIGGVLVFAVNSAVYLNQSVPPYGVVLNANGREASNFPLRWMEDKRLQLDGCAADFLTPNTLMLSLRNGDLYVVTLLADNMNAVKGLHFDKCQSSVVPSVVRKCADGYAFLGSRLGNSLLLKYVETNSYAMKVASEPPNKRARYDDDAERENGHGKLEDDLELYGEVLTVGTVESVRVSQYTFDVCDSLLNIGPCRSAAVGEPTSTSDEFQNSTDPVFDLVTASGHGKNGALVMLQRSVRPQVLTTNVISGAQRLWTVGATEEERDADGIRGAHQYLLLSKEVVTMVLELKSEISEMESSGFTMNLRTIAAGDLLSGRYVVQVSPMLVVLLQDSEEVQRIPLQLDFPVSQASIVDPYVALLTENGELLLLTLLPDPEYVYYALHISHPEIHQNVPATAVSAYKDVSGLFRVDDVRATNDEFFDDRDAETKFRQKSDSASTKSKSAVSMMTDFSREFDAGPDDEDALLYGEPFALPSKAGSDENRVKIEPAFNRRDPAFSDVLFAGGDFKTGRSLTDPNAIMPSYWLAVARENGLLEIFSLPDFRLVYMVKKFPVGFKTLFDTDPIKLALEQDRPDEKFASVQEMLLVGLGANKCRPHLFAVVDDELLIYEAFPYFGPTRITDHLPARFKRLEHGARLKNARSQRVFRRRADGTLYGSMSNDSADVRQRLHFFDDVSGYSGVFATGPYPFWFLMTSRGALRCHPMHIDGKIVSFAPFHNVNCRRGFAYLNEKREMRICQLPAHVSYDASCPAHKVNLKCTAHHVVYLLDSRTYAVNTSVRVPCKTMVTLVGDDKQFDVLDKEDPNFIYPTMEKFKIQLYTPETWEAIPEAEIELDEFEHATVLKEVQLKSEGTRSGLQNYLAAGTIYNYGEEVLVRGRILIAEVVEVVPEPGQPLTKNKVKILYSKEQKGPVTSLCSMQGYLLTGMGQKVYIWSFKDNDLMGISFLDMQNYIHQIISIRNIALVGDVFRSVCLLRYQENCKALSLASRDPRHMEVYAMEFLIDNKSLGFLISDADRNVYLYMYKPEAKESLGGQRLVRRADINAGCRISAFARVRCHAGDPVVEKKSEAAKKHLSLFANADGGLGYFLPLPEKTYRRLLMLEKILLTGVQHTAGLNPRAFRAVRQQGNVLFNSQKNILDGDLLFTYFGMNLIEKIDISKRIGTTREQLQDDLLEIERLSTHF